MLLTGATGNTGGVVAQMLRERGVPFKALARKASHAKLQARGIEPVEGDFDDPASLVAAMQGGFGSVYLVCTPDEHMTTRETNVIDAAKAAGIKRVVKLSAYSAAPDAATTNLRCHAAIEQHLAQSGLAWTVVRPHGFMQTFVVLVYEFVRDAGAYMHFCGDGALPLVDVRDVAAVVVKALTEDGHDRKIYDVTGPEVLSFKQQAALLQQGLGRPVTAVASNAAMLPRVMKMMGVAPQSVEHADVIMRLVRENKLTDKTDTLEQLGIRPIKFSEFTHDLAAGKTGGGNSFQPRESLLIDAMNTAMKWGYRAKFAMFGRPT